MTLRFTVETKKSVAFTASRKVQDGNEAEKLVNQMRMKNSKHYLYSRFILYDDSDNMIREFQ